MVSHLPDVGRLGFRLNRGRSIASPALSQENIVRLHRSSQAQVKSA